MPDSIEKFFAGYPAEVQAISRTLRAMVCSTLPTAVEVLYTRQNHVGYGSSESMAGRIVYICPMRDYVRLGFMFGCALRDPRHLLVGEGKRLRHVKVWNSKEAANPALKRLVRAAWVDPQMRAFFATRKSKR
jgi:hypothetical protein